MFKKIVLTLLIPLPLMAVVLGGAMYFEFQRQPATAALQLTPMEFVQLKVGQLIKSREARAAISNSNLEQRATPEHEVAAAKTDLDVDAAALAKTLSEAQAKQVARAQAALQASLAKQMEQTGVTAEGEAEKSFGARLSGLFSSGSKVEDEKPKRMVCKVQRGFKRCKFPEEK